MVVRPVLCRPFIGRRAELAYLREQRLEAGASRGGLVFVAGDAGLGKSRLISEFCRSLAYSRWRITRGACREFGGRPYGPILDALSSVDLQAADVTPAQTQRQFFEGIVDRFAEIASRKALVIVIEDLHWADVATLDLLAHLGSRADRMRVLVLASFRPDYLPIEHPVTAGIEKIGRAARASRLDLAPLHGVELRTFMDAALADFKLSADRRRAIALAAEGNPFYTEELLKNAVQQAEDRSGGTDVAGVPQSVRATLLERLRPFDAHDRQILTHAAVIGRTFTLELLAAVVDGEPQNLLPTLRRARDFQLIEELAPSSFRFRHGLTRDAICGDLLRTELRPLHHRIVLTLESAPNDERSIEALAYHSWAAGDDEASLRYNELAGDAARTVHAYDDAIAFYNRALESKRIDALARGFILEKIANIRLVMSMAEEGQAMYGAAAEAFAAAGAFEREAVCRVRTAMTAYTMHLSDTSAPLEQMLGRLDETEYLARARLHLGIAWITIALRLPSRAQRHLAQVDERAIAGRTDIRTRYHNVAAFVATALGNVEEFRKEHALWVNAARVHGAGALAGAYYNGAKCCGSFALHEEARENIRQALLVADEMQSRHGEECARATAALCSLVSGDLQAARDAVEAVPTTTDNRVNITFATAAGTAVGTYLGDEALIEKWFDGFEETMLSAPELECGYGFAEVLVRRGRAKDAQEFLHRVLPDCEVVRGEVPTLLAIARYGADEDCTRARRYLARGAEGGDVLERPGLALFDALCLSKQGKLELAKPLAHEAAEGFRKLRAPLLEAAAREIAGDSDAALALYRRCGAAYDVRRLESQRGGDATSAEPASDDAIAILSKREREIAVLAARGQSNLEIAAALSISHKTVEKHLASAFQKLGVSSRKALRSHL